MSGEIKPTRPHTPGPLQFIQQEQFRASVSAMRASSIVSGIEALADLCHAELRLDLSAVTATIERLEREGKMQRGLAAHEALALAEILGACSGKLYRIASLRQSVDFVEEEMAYQPKAVGE